MSHTSIILSHLSKALSQLAHSSSRVSQYLEFLHSPLLIYGISPNNKGELINKRFKSKNTFYYVVSHFMRVSGLLCFLFAKQSLFQTQTAYLKSVRQGDSVHLLDDGVEIGPMDQLAIERARWLIQGKPR